MIRKIQAHHDNGDGTYPTIEYSVGTVASDGALVDTVSTQTVTGNKTFTGAMVLPSGTTIGGSAVAALGVVTSTSANAVAVGRQGATGPAFNVDASTASQADGFNVKGLAAGNGVQVSTITTGTNAPLAIDAAGSGTITLAGTSTGAITLSRNTGVTGTATVTSSNASALTVGRQGATDPVLLVDASTSSVATGIKVKGAAAAGGIALSAISSGTDENLTIDAKGAGTITLNGTGTGNVVLGRTTTLTLSSSSTDGGTSVEPFVVDTTMTGVGGVGGRSKFALTTNVALGSWSNALKGIVTYGASGRTTGLGSAICSEMTLSAGTTSGNYAGLEIELNLGTGAQVGTATSLIYASVNGADAATFSSGAGHILNLQGLTAGASNVFRTGLTAATVNAATTAALRIMIGSTPYYIPLATATT